MAIPDSNDLGARLERVEAIDQIRQLAAKYAIALDVRDIDAMVGLYVEDVKATKEARGRQALKQVLTTVLRGFTTSVHHVGNHVIEFKDRENAEGIVYSRCEQEIEDRWIVTYLHYLDAYRKVNDRWFFRRRLVCQLYAVDMAERPAGPNKIRWPGEPAQEGNWHSSYPSWNAFWSDPRYGAAPVAPAADHDQFISTLRRGAPLPKSLVL